MIYLELFLTFLLIGVMAFGGGYAMIPLVRSFVVSNGWLTLEEVSNIIAIAESTPGPIAVNMATYVGSVQGMANGGFLGAFLGSFLCTLGVVLPAFLIILLIASILKNFKDNKYVNAFLVGIKPVVVGLIISTGLLMLIQCFYVNFTTYNTIFTSKPIFDWVSLAVIFGLIGIRILYKKLFKKNISPILLIIISAGIGMLVF
jgi:chromate transporter